SPLTGAGNLWLWLPQARVAHNVSFTRMTGLRAELGLAQTREVGPYAGSTLNGTLEAARPGYQGRFEVYHNMDDTRRFEFASGFHASTTHFAGLSAQSRVFALDWFANPWKRLEFSGAFYDGENVAPLGAGYQQGFGAFSTGLISVHSIGGWGQLTVHTLP